MSNCVSIINQGAQTKTKWTSARRLRPLWWRYNRLCTLKTQEKNNVTLTKATIWLSSPAVCLPRRHVSPLVRNQTDWSKYIPQFHLSESFGNIIQIFQWVPRCVLLWKCREHVDIAAVLRLILWFRAARPSHGISKEEMQIRERCKTRLPGKWGVGRERERETELTECLLQPTADTEQRRFQFVLTGWFSICPLGSSWNPNDTRIVFVIGYGRLED